MGCHRYQVGYAVKSVLSLFDSRADRENKLKTVTYVKSDAKDVSCSKYEGCDIT